MIQRTYAIRESSSLGKCWQIRAVSTLSLLLSVVVLVGLCPGVAEALTIEKITARPNVANQSIVLGGVPTRITWEGISGAGEQIKEIACVLPAGSTADNPQVRATVLEGLKRIEVPQPQIAVDALENGDLAIKLLFSQPLPPQVRLRLEIEGICFAPQGGEQQVITQLVCADGSAPTLEQAPPLQVQSSSKIDAAVRWLDAQPLVQAWNSNQFCGMFLKPQLIVSSIPALFKGWLLALALVAIGFPLAIPLGLGTSFLKMSKRKIFRFIGALYVNVIRGTPLFLQLYIAFFGLPLLDIHINNFVLGFMVMAINSGAYLAEIFRAGIQSIGKGQFEAAASLGMTPAQSMVFVIIPQTIRRVIPTMTSEFIMLYKDTSLLSSVGVMELMMFSKNLTATTGNITPYIVAAGYYLAVTLPLIKVVSKLEERLSPVRRPSRREDDDEQAVKIPLALKGAGHDSM